MSKIITTIALALAILAMPATARASHGLIPWDHCNARDAPRVPWTSEAKAVTRERVEKMTTALEVSGIIAAYHQLILSRESFGGEASVRHTKGEDVRGTEDGLGAYGLSLRWHSGKWGQDADPAFCTPEVSGVVAHEIMWAAVTRYGARNLVEIQAVYAGAVRCRDGQCLFMLESRRTANLCSRSAARGYSCWQPIGRDDLGIRLGPDERRAWALDRARAWVASKLGRSA